MTLFSKGTRGKNKYIWSLEPGVTSDRVGLFSCSGPAVKVRRRGHSANAEASASQGPAELETHRSAGPTRGPAHHGVRARTLFKGNGSYQDTE